MNLFKFIRLKILSYHSNPSQETKILINENFDRITEEIKKFQKLFNINVNITREFEKELSKFRKILKEINDRLDSLELRDKHNN